MIRRLPFLLLLLLLLCGSASAQISTQRITLTIVVTNRAVTSNTLVVNASTRTWTNASTATTIQTNLISTATTTTNLYNQIANFPYSGGIFPRWLSETSMALVGPLGGALAASQSGAWAILTLSTQGGPGTFTALWPIENMVGATNRTNQASALVGGMGQFSTNAFPTNSTANSNFITKGASPEQYITAPLRVTGTLRSTSQLLATNGFTSALTNINSVSSNHVNYGNAIRSEGTGGNSFQAGSNALAQGSLSVALGNSSIAHGPSSVAVGTGATATNSDTIAIGTGAIATNSAALAIGSSALARRDSATVIGFDALGDQNAVAVGSEAQASAVQSVAVGGAANATAHSSSAFGAAAVASHSNSVSIGASASTTDTNQIRLGTSAEKVSIPGALEAANVRNLNAVGTNVFNGILAFDTELVVTSVANGHNVIDAITNTVLYLTGSPSSGWTLGGFTGAKNDGRILKVFNQTGQDVTIQNESGTAPTASDRILTYAGSPNTNVLVTGNGYMEFQYSTTSARWLLVNPSVDVTATGTNGVNSIYTNGQPVSVSATSLGFIGNNLNSVNRATNASGAVSMEITKILFAATNFGAIYDQGDWEQVINEEWVAQPTSTTGNVGAHHWNRVTAGTLPTSLVAPIVDSNAWAYISMVTTQSASGQVLQSPNAGGVPVGFTLTNADFYLETRLKLNTTNLTSDVATTRVGLSDLATGTSEAANGCWVMHNTNVNTNIFLAVSGRGGARTFTYSPGVPANTYGNSTWHTIGIYLTDGGRTAYYFVGPNRYRLTSFATNTANFPGDTTTVGAFVQSDRVSSTGGLNFRTNNCDYIKLWVRPYL